MLKRGEWVSRPDLFSDRCHKIHFPCIIFCCGAATFSEVSCIILCCGISQDSAKIPYIIFCCPIYILGGSARAAGLFDLDRRDASKRALMAP
jgi:hypothetical protein